VDVVVFLTKGSSGFYTGEVGDGLVRSVDTVLLSRLDFQCFCSS
jgi:hypothetical protein